MKFAAVFYSILFAVVSFFPGCTLDPQERGFRIVVISDLNNAYGALDYEAEVDSVIARIIQDWKPDLVLCGGDMVAGQRPALSDGRVDSMWLAFDYHVGKPLRDAGIPFAFTIGNHDGSGYPNHVRDRRKATEYWTNPTHTPSLDFHDRGTFPFWYSFSAGPVFIAVWDASTETISTENLTWLQHVMNTPEAKSAEYRMVVGHLPLYGVAIGRDTPGNVLAKADSIRQLLEAMEVQLYVSGHHHAYYPGKHTFLDLLHAGAIGSGARSLLDGSNPRKTVSILDWNNRERLFEETTYDAATWAEIDIDALPDRIHSINGVIERRGNQLYSNR